MSSWAMNIGDGIEAMRSMADKSVDHIITDPPYSEHVHSKQWAGAALTAAGGKRCGTAHSELGFASITEDQAKEAMAQFSRITKRWVIVFCDLEGTDLWRRCGCDAGLDYVRQCIWDKVDSAPQFTGDRPAAGAEAFLVFHPPGKKRWNGGGRRNIYRFRVNEQRGGKPHPTTKPFGLMSAIVRDFTDHDETIVDPFAGSGSTGVAAVASGRNFIGWELSQEYRMVASSRAEATREQHELSLFLNG